jgi:uncharacterized protein Usg
MTSLTKTKTSELQKLINGYSLVTAEILYRMPDHPKLLQSYIWQEYDMEPRYPELQKFLAFWEENLEGPLYSVRVAAQRLIAPPKLSHVDYLAHIH